MVAITPGAGFVSPSASVIIGLLGGVVCYFGVRIKGKFGFDDSLDAFGVHGVGGIFGALATGVFASKLINDGGADGLLANAATGGHLFWEQIVAVAVTVAYSVIMTVIIATVINKTMGLRVDDETERKGLDTTLHGEQAYQN